MSSEKVKEGFILYTGMYDSIREFLTLDQRGMLMDAIHDYHKDDSEPPRDSPISMAFSIYKNQFRLDGKKQEKKAEVARINELRGGRPKEKTQETQETQSVILEPKITQSVISKPNESYKEKVKDKVKEKEKVKEKDSLGESSAKEVAVVVPQPLEQPEIKAEQPKQKSTLDIPTCEGHKIKIGVHEYPQQKQGIPFIHPDLIDRIPIDKRIDLWWSLYGIRQSEIKVESEMIQAGLADNDTFAKIYRHTFLYVAVTDERFRVPPVKYWKNRTWTDDIVDRRDKKTPTDNTGVAITNAPAAKNWIEREMDEIRRLKEWDKEEQKRWDEKIRLENEAKAANGGNAK